MGSKEEQEAAWLWSQRTWAQVPAPVTLHQAQRCTRLGPADKELPGWVRVPGILSGTRVAWLKEERNRHPKDPKRFQMGVFLSGWGWGCE